MDKVMMLESLIAHYSRGNKAQFAKILGIRPQTINTWISRNSFDAELIYSKCECVSGDWLLSGEGEMLRQSRMVEQRTDSEIKLLELCKTLVGLSEQKDSVMKQVVETVKNME